MTPLCVKESVEAKLKHLTSSVVAGLIDLILYLITSLGTSPEDTSFFGLPHTFRKDKLVDCLKQSLRARSRHFEQRLYPLSSRKQLLAILSFIPLN